MSANKNKDLVKNATLDAPKNGGVAPDTVVDGAALQIQQTQAILRCRACDVQEPIDELAVRCGQCGSCDTVIEGGQELLLQSIELED